MSKDRKKRLFLPGLSLSSVEASSQIFPFTLAASDSFNRADGAPGNTDGAGIDGVTGGSGIAWVDKIGTSEIYNNRLNFSAVIAGEGITVVDTTKTDGIICARVKTALSAGIVVRYIDTDNYVRIYWTSGNEVYCVQRLAGANTTLFNGSAAYVEDAELIVKLDGLRVSAEYNGTYINSADMNAAFASSTLHGLYVTGAASIYNFNEFHFINLPAYQAIQKPSVLKYFTGTGELMLTAPVRNDATRCAEWDIRQERTYSLSYYSPSNVRHIMNHSVVTIATGAKVSPGLNSGGWEAAGMIGADADAEGDYGFFGSVHQNEALTSISESIPGLAAVPRWKRVYTNRFQLAQVMNTIYPKDQVTVIGTTTLFHILTVSGLTVKRTHTYSAGYKIYGWYGAMMPVYNPTVDSYKVGSNAAALMVKDDGVKNLNTQTDTYKAWLAAGDYTVVMFLPTGGPDDNGDWSKAASYKGWFKDNATSPQKFYTNYVSTNSSEKAAAVTSSHTVLYYVENGIPA